MRKDVTLQINISPGDINYAALTVPALLEQHKDIKKKLLVVDCCRPQRTKLVDPNIRFPSDKFKKNVEKIKKICMHFVEEELVSDIYFLYADDPLIDRVAKKYLRGIYNTTHAAGGAANMSYWIGIDMPDTRYVLHYDADMMLYQASGYRWVDEAILELESNQNVLMAVPRLCPPINNVLPSLHEGRPIMDGKNYWLNDWFSTRQFLLDKSRLEQYLPLVTTKVMIELMIRKYTRRAFPIDPEILLFKSVGSRHGRRLMLKNEQSWSLHPDNKSQSYIEILPQMISLIKKGIYPPAQRGYENINLEAWMMFIQKEMGD